MMTLVSAEILTAFLPVSSEFQGAGLPWRAWVQDEYRVGTST